MVLLENNKMLPCKIKMQKKKANFFNWSAARTADLRHVKRQCYTLDYRASPVIATVKTACNWDHGDTIAFKTVARGRHSRSTTLAKKA